VFPASVSPVRPTISITNCHQLVVRQLEQRVTNRDFHVSISVRLAQQGADAVDFGHFARVVDQWLAKLDPDMRFGEPRLTVRSGPIEAELRANGKPALVRGSKSLIANQAPGFPIARRAAEVRRAS
jgi:hypothetical protein